MHVYDLSLSYSGFLQNESFSRGMWPQGAEVRTEGWKMDGGGGGGHMLFIWSLPMATGFLTLQTFSGMSWNMSFVPCLFKARQWGVFIISSRAPLIRGLTHWSQVPCISRLSMRKYRSVPVGAPVGGSERLTAQGPSSLCQLPFVQSSVKPACRGSWRQGQEHTERPRGFSVQH